MSEDQKGSLPPGTPSNDKNVGASGTSSGVNGEKDIKKDAGANLFEDHIREEKKEGT